MRNRIPGLLACLCLASGLAGCGGTLPPDGPPTIEIRVSVDHRHCVVEIPGRDRWGRTAYEEWAYAERAWYLEKRRGACGVLRSLFWPTRAVVARGIWSQPYAELAPAPPPPVWRFRISESALGRMRGRLAAEVEGDLIAPQDLPVFLPASRSYHLFSHCRLFAARILRAGGIPISPWAAWTRQGFGKALDREAERNRERVDGQEGGGKLLWGPNEILLPLKETVGGGARIRTGG